MRFCLLLIFYLCVTLTGRAEALQVGLLDLPDNPLIEEGRASSFLDQLGERLGEKVQSRWFTSHRDLLAWLEIHREIDLALLPARFISDNPDIQPLVSWTIAGTAAPWSWVVGPGDPLAGRQLLKEILSALVAEFTAPVVGESARTGFAVPAAEGAPGPPRTGPVPAVEVAPVATGDEEHLTSAAKGETDPGGEGSSATLMDIELSGSGDDDVGIEPVRKLPSPPAGETSFDQLDQQPVDIEANQLRFDEASGTYHAQGDVLIKAGPVTLQSETVDLNPATSDVVAEGYVQLTAPEGVLQGEALSINMKTGLGTLERGSFFIKENNFHVAGEQIEKIDTNTYHLTKGTFTTCEGDKPDWHFSATDLEVTIDGYAKGKHAFFYVRDIPLLYTPYLIYPVKRKRETGFLVPSVGYSTNRGAQVFVPFYWAIARNQDATFHLDWLSELGLGKGVEYRYLFDDDNAGELHYYHVSGVKGEADRYAYEWQHDGMLPHEWRLKSDVDYVSSRDYWRDFGEVAGEYNKDLVDSTISVNRNWDMLNLTTQLQYTKDLQKSNDNTLQRLPEVRLEVLRQRYKETPFYYELASSATYFWRREGLTGERVIARPAISGVWQPGNIFEIQPEIGYTERLYWTSSEGPGYENNGIYDFSTKVSTRVAKVYSLGMGSISKVRHSIEPDATYLFIPKDDQSDLPQFDSLDRIESNNSVGYGVTNRLVAKIESPEADPVYHEFLYLRFSQEYDIEESRRDLLDPADEKRPFSAIRTEMIFRPTRKTLLDIDARYDPHHSEQHFTSFNALARHYDGNGNGINLEYRYSRDEVEYADAGIDLALLDPVYLNYRYRYDLSSNVELEKVLNLEYRSQCWSIFFTYRDRLEDKEYLVSFALTGLGKVAEFGGSLGEYNQEN